MYEYSTVLYYNVYYTTKTQANYLNANDHYNSIMLYEHLRNQVGSGGGGAFLALLNVLLFSHSCLLVKT